MKPVGKSAIALAILFPLLSAIAWSQELLPNPGFELGGAPAGSCADNQPAVSGTLANYWTENSCGMGGAPSSLTFGMDASTLHSGSLSQRVDTTGNVGRFWTPVALENGKKYTASIWLKANAPMQVYLQLRAQDEPYTAYGGLLANVGTGWQKFTFDGLAPASGSAVAGGLFVLPQAPGTLWLDDASVTSVVDAAVATLRTDTVPANYFGMHTHRDPNWPSVGNAIGSDRMWDGEGVQWADIFPNDPALGGAANWTKFDARVAAAIAKGAEPVMVLGGDIPRWASSDYNGTQPGSSRYGPGSSAPPVSEAVWTAWVTAVAQHAKGKVKYWEIWNEPYQSAVMAADVPRVARLAQLAYPILKSIDANNKVLSPSFDAHDPLYMEKYLQAGGGAYMDIVSLHAYDFFHGNLLDGTVPASSKKGDPASPEAMYYKEHLLRNAKSILTRYGYGSKPVWNTEGGYEAFTATGAIDDAAGAPFLARNLIMGWAMGGIDRNFFYSWDNRGRVAGGREAVLYSNVYAKTAAGRAFEQVATWLTGSKMESRSVDANGTWVITLNPGALYAKRYLVWNPYGNHSYTAPSGVSYVTTLDNNKTAIPAGFQAKPSPVLLTRY